MDTILDYTYDVNYSVQKGECLKLDMNKSLPYCMEYEDHIGASNTIPFEMESVDIDGEGRIYHTSTSGFKYDCYLKDHLGSTRMVVNDENVVTEAFAYQPYGTIIPLEDIAATPQTPTRQQFTGKEFDTEGEDSENGVVGIQAYHFCARVYDPELGVFISCDPAEVYFNSYSNVGGNPVIFIDPNGEEPITAILMITGALLGAYAGGSFVNETFDPTMWNWKDISTYAGMVIGGAAGAMGGYMAGGAIAGTGSVAFSGTFGYGLQAGSEMMIAGLQIAGEIGAAAAPYLSVGVGLSAVGGGTYMLWEAYKKELPMSNNYVRKLFSRKGPYAALHYIDDYYKLDNLYQYYKYVEGEGVLPKTEGMYVPGEPIYIFGKNAFYHKGKYDSYNALRVMEHETGHKQFNKLWENKAKHMGLHGEGRTYYIEYNNYGRDPMVKLPRRMRQKNKKRQEGQRRELLRYIKNRNK